MLSLTIYHKIFLNKEQRYALHDNVNLVVVGISVPVWFSKKNTSEPSKEIFCNYHLKNTKKDVPIQILNDGYEIILPNRKGSRPEISNEEWRELNRNGKIKEEYYDKCIQEVSSKNLLDLKDGGIARLAYREHNVMKKNETHIKIAHYIEIEDMQKLTESMCFVL